MKKNKICLVGGGSTFTPGIVKSIVERSEDLNLEEVVLYDIDEERQKKVSVIVEWILRKQLKSNVTLTVTTDAEQAFTGAKFIFAQMRVGGYKMREQDEKIPLSFGCVGQETCGAGGLAYGLRTIGPMIELIDQVEKYALADHWILNYSNPAAIVSEACRKIRPKARIINVCDMPIAIIDMIAGSLNITDTSEIKYDYFGLNHFGWFTSITYRDRDLLEEIKNYVNEHKILLPPQYIERLKENRATGDRHAVSSWIHVWESVYTMLQAFPDYLPNTYLTYYLLQKETVEHQNPDLTRANEVMNTREKALFEGVDKYLSTGEVDESSFHAGSHGDWISDLAVALLNDTKTRFLVITENKGAIPNMPYDAMVEVPAYVGKNGPEVIAQEPVPLFYQGLMMQQLNSEKLIVEAYIENSYEKALQSFSLNKTIPSINVARLVLEALIKENESYWPDLN
ncbi:6-phospho-alpha-glucosidase [Halolactibacillus miurensis]|uniref:6-phospho-alpha-glucosidase n=1 Tax=Halolactibacillus miurensis TaxID=306541 RepID=A0A1I6P0H5_9BACI|nr:MULTISPECIES: 6-phospho-alpha-glucosidase [Halolactibacillus]GEM03204.1 6-phospho-alpha-glucosidase [Halolactibacillus miurensis]SFS33694.1 maltose-6'-phosphate glucosidase [Halolactibacillus miurensis]